MFCIDLLNQLALLSEELETRLKDALATASAEDKDEEEEKEEEEEEEEVGEQDGDELHDGQDDDGNEEEEEDEEDGMTGSDSESVDVDFTEHVLFNHSLCLFEEVLTALNVVQTLLTAANLPKFRGICCMVQIVVPVKAFSFTRSKRVRAKRLLFAP